MKNGLRFLLLALASVLLGVGTWLLSEKPDVRATVSRVRTGIAETVDTALEAFSTPVPEATPTPAPTDAPETHVDASGKGLTDADLVMFENGLYLVELNLVSNDLSVAAVDALMQKLPNCDIRWSVPIGGRRFDSALTDIVLPAGTTAQELYNLRFFRNLRFVDGRQTSVGEDLYDYSFGRANVEFRYEIDIGGVRVDDDAESCTLNASDVSPDTLPALVHMLPKLRAINFTGKQLTWGELDALRAALPGIEITADIEINGEWYPMTTESLDLSGAKIDDVTDLSNRLLRLPMLKTVDVTDTNLDETAYNALCAARSDVLFVRTVQVGGFTVRTDIRAFSNRMTGGTGGVALTGDSAELTGDDLRNLRLCTELVALEIDGEDRLTDLTALSTLKNLKYLTLSDCELTDITALGELKSLVMLDLTQNCIGDFSALRGLTALEELNVGSNLPPSGETTREELRLGKLETLMQMTWLKRLWCMHNSFGSEEIGELAAALPETTVVAKNKAGDDAEWETGPRVREMRELIGIG